MPAFSEPDAGDRTGDSPRSRTRRRTALRASRRSSRSRSRNRKATSSSCPCRKVGSARPDNLARSSRSCCSRAQTGSPTIYNFVPTTPGQPPANGGFGDLGSPTPGVIQQAPVQPGQIVPPRPPGGQ